MRRVIVGKLLGRRQLNTGLWRRFFAARLQQPVQSCNCRGWVDHANDFRARAGRKFAEFHQNSRVMLPSVINVIPLDFPSSRMDCFMKPVAKRPLPLVPRD